MLIETAISDLDQNKFLGFGPLWYSDINSNPSSLDTRPKLILNAEPLVTIHMQVLVVLFDLHGSNYHNCCLQFKEQYFFFLFCTNKTGFENMENQKDINIRCAFSTTGEWLKIF